jgi:hypothetical protein
MNYILTQHARNALLKRKISIAWLERVLQFPMRTDPDENDAELEHRLAVIAEHGDRVLRMVVNTKAFPMRIVTAYFDRNMKGHL